MTVRGPTEPGETVVSRYQATRASLRRHPVPGWYEDAKLGIFIHWGLFSVPAFAARLGSVSEAFTRHYRLSSVMTPYTEWYDNALRVPESPTAEHHARHWGGRSYADFRNEFTAGLARWDPADWASLFRRAGARYVVLVTKHHDGYCLWPSRVANPHRSGWTSQRDLVGELADAVRREGLRFGVYYSGGIDWSFRPEPVRTLVEFVGSVPGGDYPDYAEAQVRELVECYRPSVLWNDISWPTPLRPLLRLFADYYEAVPEGVVNDRWMHRGPVLRLLSRRPVQRLLDAVLERAIRRQDARGEYTGGLVPPRPVHYDFRTPEYTTFSETRTRKWETTRGLTASFGYNHRDREEDHEDPDELVRSFVDTVSKNGNLLLNVGPRGVDAAIPEPQRRRLEALGAWLARNGEAVYETRPAARAEGVTGDGISVRFTRGPDALYAILLGESDPEVTIEDAPVEGLGPEPAAIHVPDGRPVPCRLDGRRLRVSLGDRTRGPAVALRFEATPRAPRGRPSS